MIGAILGALAQGAAFGAGAGAGDRWVQNHTGPAVTVPYWQGSVNGTTLALQVTRWHAQISYSLYVVADGISHYAGWWPTYPQALATIQFWQHYLQTGGTVAGWLRHGMTDQLAQRRAARVIEAP